MNLENAKKKEKAIRTLEELGYEVTLIKEKHIVYSKHEQENKYCNNCQFCFKTLVNDSADPFEMEYKLYCKALGGICIASYDPCDDAKTKKPLACPKLGRELSKEEEKEVQKWLEVHQKYF